MEHARAEDEFLFRDFPKEEVSLDGDLSSPWVKTMLQNAGELPEFSALRCQLQLTGVSEEGVYFRGSFEGEAKVPCDRCAEDFKLHVADDEIHCLIKQQKQGHPKAGVKKLPKQKDDDEVEVSPEESDSSTHWFSGPQFRAGDVLAEYVQLALPFKRLCSESCRGVCAGCGENLNTSSCRCEAEVVVEKPNPFAALKKLKKE